MTARRSFFKSLFGLGAGMTALMQSSRAQLVSQRGQFAPAPVVTPDVADLPFTMDNGVKVFRLVAELVKQLVVPGRTLDLWGFNRSAPGPTIQANVRQMAVKHQVSASA